MQLKRPTTLRGWIGAGCAGALALFCGCSTLGLAIGATAPATPTPRAERVTEGPATVPTAEAGEGEPTRTAPPRPSATPGMPTPTPDTAPQPTPVGDSEKLCLVKVRYNTMDRSEIMDVVNIFRGKVVDVASESYIVEVTGTEDKIEAFINLLRPYGIKEVVRTGIVAMFRGAEVLAAHEDGTPAVAEGHEGRLAREGSEADFV